MYKGHDGTCKIISSLHSSLPPSLPPSLRAKRSDVTFLLKRLPTPSPTVGGEDGEGGGGGPEGAREGGRENEVDECCGGRESEEIGESLLPSTA